jgi:tetratricopeptide (TPR) repeat protein
LRIPAKTSSFSFKGKSQTVQEIGRSLSVETVLEGTVQVADDRLRITAWLSKVDDGYQIWSESYDKNFEEVFSVQDDIAQKIADALKIEFLGDKKEKIVTHYTSDPAAYELYTRGYFFLDKRGESNIKQAVEFFEKAIELDPNYALAYLGLAESHVNLGDWGYLPSAEAYPKAREAANRALELENSLSEAYCVLAMVKYTYDWDWEKAEELFKLSIKLKPNYAVAHKEYGLYLTKLKRFDEARKELEKAQALDPVSLATLSQATWPLRYSGRYDEAIEQLKQVLQMDPDFGPAQNYLANCYFWNGMLDEALELNQKRGDEYGLALCYAKMGRIGEAKEIINRLISTQAAIPRDLAGFYFLIGENERGYYWLERGIESRDYSLGFLEIYEAFDTVRSEDRFKEIMKKVGLKN